MHEVFINDAMKPSKMLRHLKSKHSELENKPCEYFERRKQELGLQTKAFKQNFVQNKSLLKCSYLVALRIAKTKKSFTTGENLIKPVLIDVCSEMFGPSAADKIKTIPLSNDTIRRRIEKISENVESPLIHKIKESIFFAIQIDESCDIAKKAILICYVRYVDFVFKEIKEELLCCIELVSYTTSSEIFNALNAYIIKHSLEWKNCIGVCTDGAASMIGKHCGVTKRIQEVANSDFLITHYIIHRQHLAAKSLSTELNEVLEESIKIINFIKKGDLNSRLFAIFCQEIGAEYEQLLLYTEVRWLSRGRILTRLFELRTEVEIFLIDKKNPLKVHLSDIEWVAKLAYLSDIFSYINELNLSLQGTAINAFHLFNKIAAFKKKINFWLNKINSNNIDIFNNYYDFVNSQHDLNLAKLNIIIAHHLQSLNSSFERYFPSDNTKYEKKLWITNPFITYDNSQLNLTHREYESVLEISSDIMLKRNFSRMSLDKFWVNTRNEYPSLYEKAMKMLLPFATTYLCETGFSAMTVIKNKFRNRLSVVSPLRLSLTNLEPTIEKLIEEEQQQSSH
ncbi:zinc finger MYM-type protein 6-like [Onthophagus taurus]|uniref:zinc finger MYM-type protein 6-like n=1 Tax=Onthophagus taurus TaxID=166361 RepID=UPI0039BE0253